MNESWHEDILGAPFFARKIELGADDEGPLEATLVRRLAKSDCHRAVLYIHGYCDYFFQVELAERFVERGFNFYALDLRRYGRSLLPHQTPNFCTDMSEYFDELDAAQTIIRGEDGNRSVLLNGHSTGGLLAALYADRDSEEQPLDAVFLNSPFFEFNESWLARKLLLELVSAVGDKNPRRPVPGGLSTLYGESVHHNHHGSWDYNLDWKPLEGFPLLAGWLRAVQEGQKGLQAGLAIPCPVLVMHSTASSKRSSWDDELLRSDAVLDIEHISRYTLGLGDRVTRVRIAGGLHDLMLSAPEVRINVFDELFTWLSAYGPA